MRDYDFSKLTTAQQSVLTFQGWEVGSDMRQPSKATVKKLIERGLVIPQEVKTVNMTVIEYQVPIDVHMAWCAHCAKR
jgi:hypothetical protein